MELFICSVKLRVCYAEIRTYLHGSPTLLGDAHTELHGNIDYSKICASTLLRGNTDILLGAIDLVFGAILRSQISSAYRFFASSPAKQFSVAPKLFRRTSEVSSWRPDLVSRRSTSALQSYFKLLNLLREVFSQSAFSIDDIFSRIFDVNWEFCQIGQLE